MTDLLDALGITLAVSTEPLDRPVWVESHRILIVGQDVTEDDVLAAAWEACRRAGEDVAAGGGADR